jgi:hypothetical protein
LGVSERECGLDERGVGERLGIVAEVIEAGGVHLFGEETERRGELYERREPVVGIPTAPPVDKHPTTSVQQQVRPTCGR